MANRIKYAREQAGLSQRQLASLAGLTQQMISKLEKGRSRSTSGIISIAQALQVSPEWLWLGSENNTPTAQCPHHDCPFCSDKSLFANWNALTERQKLRFRKEIMCASN
ncbi:MAG: helix-turn-helix transcriptional regulator [Porticoccaceae bacterium]|nr:helix-turn-helix transcriptional regulator [Pseudomonadales bacterium]MCP5170931.1 helix-turn-helix transcriptional regulator [Pseudomonadales bacterium]MCP5301829.1 helix-turn-helix transcriptional regulator [Pseudomonadales bacterium]